MIVDSYRFLPRTFRPLYKGCPHGPFLARERPAPLIQRAEGPGQEGPGLYVRGSHAAFDLDGERERPDWGDPTWRAIPSSASDLGVAHLHINDEDLLADPEIALPRRLLSELSSEGVIGGVVDSHVAVMGYQDRNLSDWRSTTAPAIVSHLRQQGADALVLAPA